MPIFSSSSQQERIPSTEETLGLAAGQGIKKLFNWLAKRKQIKTIEALTKGGDYETEFALDEEGKLKRTFKPKSAESKYAGLKALAEASKSLKDVEDEESENIGFFGGAKKFLFGGEQEGKNLRRQLRGALQKELSQFGGAAQTEFDSPEEADASGLPAGTIVLVKGRKYQI